MIYGGEFSKNKLYSLVTPPHQAACGVLVKVILMIYGGEFSINKLYSLVTPPHQAAYGVLVKVILMIYSASQNMIYAYGV